MHYNADKPILISDIAEYSHTSSRNLQIGFKKYKDTTPMRFLRMIRLSKVRDEIISGCGVETWQAIALKWGFNDLMLFKKYYQQAYHELPDQTLMRFRMGIRKG